jgi:hypothetical protein
MSDYIKHIANYFINGEVPEMHAPPIEQQQHIQQHMQPELLNTSKSKKASSSAVKNPAMTE